METASSVKKKEDMRSLLSQLIAGRSDIKRVIAFLEGGRGRLSLSCHTQQRQTSAFPACFCPEAGKAVKFKAPLGINSDPVWKNGPLSTLLDHIWSSADLEMFCFIRTLTLHPKPSTPSYC